MLGLVVALAVLIHLAMMINFVSQAMGIPHGSGKVSVTLGLGDLFSLLDPAVWRAMSLAKLPMVLAKAAGMAFLLWIFFATTIKRLHDRDRSAWWVLPFLVLPCLYDPFYDRFSDQLPDSWLMMIPG